MTSSGQTPVGRRGGAGGGVRTELIPRPSGSAVAASAFSGEGARKPARGGETGAVAATQEALYRAHDLELSWSEATLPER